MTMDAMVRYLEDRGFKAEKKYDTSTKSYRFTIERDGSYLVRYFKWLNCDKPWLHQEQFLKGMVEDFERAASTSMRNIMETIINKQKYREHDAQLDVRSLYPALMPTDNFIKYIVKEKEQEEMNMVKWKITNIDITSRIDEAPDVEVKLKAYFNPYVGVASVDPIKLTEILDKKLNGRDPAPNCRLTPSTKLPQIEKVIFNDPATIIIWKDGTKTVVKAINETYDPEKGLAMAITKKALGNEGNYYETIKKWVGDCRCDLYHSAKWLATQRLYNALGDKKATKADLKLAMEEAIKYLETK